MSNVFSFEKKRSEKDAEEYASNVLTKVLVTPSPEFQTAALSYMLDFSEKQTVRLETMDGFRFEVSEKSKILSAASKRTFSLHEMNDSTLRLKFDGDSYYYDLYLKEGLKETMPDLFELTKQALEQEIKVNSTENKLYLSRMKLLLHKASVAPLSEDKVASPSELLPINPVKPMDAIQDVTESVGTGRMIQSDLEL